MGYIPVLSSGAYRPVTIMITVINVIDNTPVLSLCQEGTGGTGVMREGGNIYCLENPGEFYSVCSS